MADVAAPVFKKRTNKSANLRKRPATPPPESDSDADYTSDEGGVRVKRRKKEGLKTGTAASKPAQDVSKSTAYAADRSADITKLDDATKHSNWYEDASKSAERVAKPTAPAEDAEDGTEGVYKGTAKYNNFIQKNPNALNKTVGPVKASTNVRTITVTDFAPDVCKDYKQTGFCGFGDSCKFLHAREDYKQGWQLDKEWESVTKDKKKLGGTVVSSANRKAEDMDEDEAEEAMLENIPFACIICREPYTRPIITKCGHYFCEKCAMTRYMKEKKRTCAACGSDTGGTFNAARTLQKLLEKKRKRVAERKEKAREAGEELSDDDEDGE